ncbi:uncharacterized protein NESG_00224 [Nematocida ausubeli]|uniref:J domain-containing protein n=1 Tax=Nematocida ausubeli (strain ATCC PRA-371 / ERTm2) TaxID=1913371 RepID=A0A086J4T1_NEMA1|nr:uncharacterized protein NESG_00224 [Nematocida ausubeli]KFG27149.1 hypothetical protein NESG_00224 [Nematocida ausubeli]
MQKIFVKMPENTLFHVFSIPRETFTNDLLKKSYHSLIKQVHPDKTATHSTAADAAQFINKAYKVLSNDYTRSIYEYSLDNAKNLVEREMPHGITTHFSTVMDLEKERVGCNKGLVSAEFLDSILSLEDQIDSADSSTLDSLQQHIMKEIQTCKENKKKATWLARWRYYNRLLDIILHKRMIE